MKPQEGNWNVSNVVKTRILISFFSSKIIKYAFLLSNIGIIKKGFGVRKALLITFL